ncbi:hypothetical protein B566_EDAN017379 [Ephemera danica]|nr:hypothetical protein B566_EDAN017379 [Ephemera danica]
MEVNAYQLDDMNLGHWISNICLANSTASRETDQINFRWLLIVLCTVNVKCNVNIEVCCKFGTTLPLEQGSKVLAPLSMIATVISALSKQSATSECWCRAAATLVTRESFSDSAATPAQCQNMANFSKRQWLTLAAERKGASATEYGLVFGVFELVVFIVSPIFGKHLNQLGPKLLFNGGIFTVGSCAILFGLLDHVEGHLPFIGLSFVIRIVEALGNAAFLTASFAIIAKEFPDSVATTFASLETFFGLGLIVGPTVGGALYQVGGYTTPFAVMGSALFLSAVMTAVFELSPVVLGLMFVINGGTYALTAPAFGWLCDTRVRPKTITVLGCALVAVGFSLNFMAERAGSGGSRTYGLISGLWTSTFALGAFIGPSAAGVLFDSVGFRNSTVVVGLSVLVFLCCGQRRELYKELRPEGEVASQHETPSADPQVQPSSNGTSKQSGRRWRRRGQQEVEGRPIEQRPPGMVRHVDAGGWQLGAGWTFQCQSEHVTSRHLRSHAQRDNSLRTKVISCGDREQAASKPFFF